jgi:EAL domain-containing protein (putative c-di-GMP-specific phosphodiesterase class I)
MLKNVGCDMAQGYFIAKPLSLASFIEFCAGYLPDKSDVNTLY